MFCAVAHPHLLVQEHQLPLCIGVRGPWEVVNLHTVDGSELGRSPVDVVKICKYPVIYGDSFIQYIPSGAGWLPSIVAVVAMGKSTILDGFFTRNDRGFFQGDLLVYQGAIEMFLHSIEMGQ